MTLRPARGWRRIGVFGGTFDPPHVGHLALAERARDELGLDRVLFVTAARPPHKGAQPLSRVVHRIAMTRLAVRGFKAFEACDLELLRRGPSYTVDTLRALHGAHPGAALWLLLGEDSLRGFPTWKQPAEILELARLAIAPRSPGAGRKRSIPRSPAGLAQRLTWLPGPVLEVSSSDLRERAQRGASLSVLVPEPVVRYVRRHRLYVGGA